MSAAATPMAPAAMARRRPASLSRNAQRPAAQENLGRRVARDITGCQLAHDDAGLDAQDDVERRGAELPLARTRDGGDGADELADLVATAKRDLEWAEVRDHQPI